MDDFQFQTLSKGIDGINARLDRQNGRLGAAEQDIAVLQDRSNRMERNGGLFGAIWGGAVAGCMLIAKATLERMTK